MLASIAVGAAVGVVAAAILWLLLEEMQREAPRQAVPAVLMMVAAALVAADLLRDDAGFVAATLMGMVLANQRRIDVSLTLEFQGTLVQLLIGVLFVLIAASVSRRPSVRAARARCSSSPVMVFVIRPLAVALATCASNLTCASGRSWPGWRRAASSPERRRRRSGCSSPRPASRAATTCCRSRSWRSSAPCCSTG